MRLDYVENDLTAAGGYMNIHNGPGFDSPVFLQGKPIVLDGLTEIGVRLYIAASEPNIGASIGADLWDGSTNLGSIVDTSSQKGGGVAGRNASTINVEVFYIPEPGEHTYAVRLWAVDDYGVGGGTIYSGSNGFPFPDPNRWWPAYMRVTASATLNPPPPSSTNATSTNSFVLSDTHETPFVFKDLLQRDDSPDFVWADQGD